MKTGEDYERRGFELLLQRPDFPAFFDALAQEGLFDPSRNSGPVEADKPGYYRVPYWLPVSYLEAAASIAGGKPDTDLAEKVMEVVRNVTRWRDSDGKPRDNYSTWMSFAKIMGLLPLSAVTLADIELTPIWLTWQFHHSAAGYILAAGALRKFLASNDHGDWAKACRILYHLTAVVFVKKGSETEKTTTDVQTVLEDFRLKELIGATAPEFGAKVGKDAADIFLTRVTDLFAHATGGHDTWVFRPAIEEHQQNFEWRGPFNQLRRRTSRHCARVAGRELRCGAPLCRKPSESSRYGDRGAYRNSCPGSAVHGTANHCAESDFARPVRTRRTSTSSSISL